MTNSFTTTDKPKAKLPAALNVLTILTFIGSAYEIFSGVLNYFTSKFAYDQTLINQADFKTKNVPGFLKSFAGPEMVAAAKANYDYRVEILIIYIIGAAICVTGAILIRKLNFNGLYIYLLGLWGTVGTYLFLLGKNLSSFVTISALAIPIIMTILYVVFTRDIRKSVIEEY